MYRARRTSAKVQVWLVGGAVVFWICSVRWTAPNRMLPTSKIYTQGGQLKPPREGARVANLTA
jgi:hypothetical protein